MRWPREGANCLNRAELARRREHLQLTSVVFERFRPAPISISDRRPQPVSMNTSAFIHAFSRRLLGVTSLFTFFAICPFVMAATVELIPRELLFGNPSRTSPQLRPDGTMLAFFAPRDGVMNLWVCPVEKLDEAKPLTAEKARPLPLYAWSAPIAGDAAVTRQNGQ
jgi:hypothetical protein